MNPVLVQNLCSLWLLREIVKGNKDRSTIFNDKGVVVAQCVAEFDYLRPVGRRLHSRSRLSQFRPPLQPRKLATATRSSRFMHQPWVRSRDEGIERSATRIAPFSSIPISQRSLQR